MGLYSRSGRYSIDVLIVCYLAFLMLVNVYEGENARNRDELTRLFHVFYT